MEANQMPIKWQTEKPNIIIWFLSSHKKKWISDLCYNMDELWENILSDRSQSQKDQILYDSICIKCPEQGNQ